MNRYNEKCSVVNCCREVGRKGARGLCSAHYKRILYLKNKDLNKPIQRRGEGWISSHGYRYLGEKSEHRTIVESHIGRILKRSEVIHHRDGNKLNNQISNLEIMCTGNHVAIHTAGKSNQQRKIEKEKYGICLPINLGGRP